MGGHRDKATKNTKPNGFITSKRVTGGARFRCRNGDEPLAGLFQTRWGGNRT